MDASNDIAMARYEMGISNEIALYCRNSPPVCSQPVTAFHFYGHEM
jgi:hypothetical protein